MGHELAPSTGQSYIEPQEIVRRLRDVFQYVDANINRATVRIEESIHYMLTVKELFTDEQIEKAQRAKAKSIDVIVADERGSNFLNFLIKPDEPIFIDYESAQQEESLQPLLKRVADVLNYEIELV